MQVYGISRLTSNTMRRAFPIFRNLLQTETLRTTNFCRFASTGSDQQKQNDDKKTNMTNLFYILGGLAGAGLIYSVIRNRKISQEKQKALSEYDNKRDDANKTLAEKAQDLQDGKSLDEDSKSVKKEELTPHIPNFAQYLIIGGGTTAMSAFKTIRALDPTAKVLVVSAENYMPYMRPPLSKDIWYTDDDDLISKHSFKQWNGNEKSLYFIDNEFYSDVKTLNEQENGGVAVVLGRKVTNLDLKNSVAKLDNGWEVTFEKCLIATGGQGKNLKIFQTVSNRLKNKITLYRGVSIDSYIIIMFYISIVVTKNCMLQ
ncbi:unnamed protein product [Rotaria socialis]|uniref:FAD/NAD(P)-binding domain-containing protein n=3 Tax=Rotaria socialis TaxID=392032 RepID=A0A818WMM7_9BILA|nr:unnamed protein product [Rotaria socialis]CAF3345880.1 unnamed protein product [Rotaria socialis]CAF3393992.1 unnamed protein product [Rotaria socialis]CAF3566634.1 unnamed protein product [Rotaria socialis]CAF3727091.1 unnamed protein product [Rotaria socialis]